MSAQNSNSKSKYKTGFFYKSCLYSSSDTWIHGSKPGIKGELRVAISINKLNKEIDIAIFEEEQEEILQDIREQIMLSFSEMNISEEEQLKYVVLYQTPKTIEKIPISELIEYNITHTVNYKIKNENKSNYNIIKQQTNDIYINEQSQFIYKKKNSMGFGFFFVTLILNILFIISIIGYFYGNLPLLIFGILPGSIAFYMLIKFKEAQDQGEFHGRATLKYLIWIAFSPILILYGLVLIAGIRQFFESISKRK